MTTLVRPTDVLEAMFAMAEPGWLPEPLIQRSFKKIFGSIRYKDAMDDLRLYRQIVHEYHQDERTGKKYWRYMMMPEALSPERGHTPSA